LFDLPFLAGFSSMSGALYPTYTRKNQKGLLDFPQAKRPIFCQHAINVLAKKRILIDETATNF
jgi:hypothetical protein